MLLWVLNLRRWNMTPNHRILYFKKQLIETSNAVLKTPSPDLPTTLFPWLVLLSEIDLSVAVLSCQNPILPITLPSHTPHLWGFCSLPRLELPCLNLGNMNHDTSREHESWHLGGLNEMMVKECPQISKSNYGYQRGNVGEGQIRSLGLAHTSYYI